MDQIIDAWSSWLGGIPVGSHDLWGITITGWGRIGKFFQFLAGLVIVAEIVGPERLRHFGESMRITFASADARRMLANYFRWFGTAVVFLFGFSSEEEQEKRRSNLLRTRQTYATFGVAIIAWVVLFLPWFSGLSVARTVSYVSWLPALDVVEVDLRVAQEYIPWQSWQTDLTWLPDLGVLEIPTLAILLVGGYLAFLAFVYTVGPIVTLLIWIGLAWLTVVTRMLIFAMAKVLEDRDNERLLKVGAVVLLAIGFHFDLLAS